MKLSSEENHDYLAKIESVDYPKESVIGSRIKIKVKITNKNTFPWFTQSEPIYISTKSGEEANWQLTRSGRVSANH